MNLVDSLIPVAVAVGAMSVVAWRFTPELPLPRYFALGLFVCMTARYAWWRMTQTLPEPTLGWGFAMALGFLALDLLCASLYCLNAGIITRFRDRRVCRSGFPIPRTSDRHR